MRAVILAGGLGTRLRPYTTILPKPLVPIGDRPILEDIIHRLAACDVRDIDLCVGHHGQLIQVYFSQATSLPSGVKLRWHWEEEALGTAGALKGVPNLDETFIAMNGDVLTTIDYRDLLRHHRDSGATMTVAMQAKSVDIELGVIEHDNGFITGYREKPTLHYDVSMGIYVYEPRVLRFLPTACASFPTSSTGSSTRASRSLHIARTSSGSTSAPSKSTNVQRPRSSDGRMSTPPRADPGPTAGM